MTTPNRRRRRIQHGHGGCPAKGRPLYFCGFAGPIRNDPSACPIFPQLTSPRVHDPIAAGRSAAARAVAVEVAAAGLVALGFLVLDGRHALAAAIGGAAMAAGNALSTAIALGGGIQPASSAFARLLLGVMGKWMVVLATFALALAAWRLPPLPPLVGLAASALAYLLALNRIGARAGRNTQG